MVYENCKLKGVKELEKLANASIQNQNKSLSFSDYLIEMQKERDLTFKGLKKSIENSRIELFKEVNK